MDICEIDQLNRKEIVRVGEAHIINDKMTLIDYEKRENYGGMKGETEAI